MSNQARASAPIGRGLRHSIMARRPIPQGLEPTPEDRERWRRQAEQEKAALAKLLADHPRRVAEASSPLREILELHAPETPAALDYRHRSVCAGCDGEGYECEHPEWPCRTYRVAIGEQP